MSRSKCGDLITACVPVTWAASIIVSESTDAIDYYDGFGTTELVIGIRAYQWGWEYYYPRNLDLNYNLKKNYSSFIGNSLKYEKSSNLFSNKNNIWKSYQNKSGDQIVTPSYLLLVPSDNYKIVNLLNFNDIGASKLNESNAFKKIRILSKSNNSDLFNSYSIYNKKFNTFQKLSSHFNELESSNFSSKRQTSYVNASSFLANASFPLDQNSLTKVINNNFKLASSKSKFTRTKSNYDNFFYLFNKELFSKINNFKNYFDLTNLINNNSDKKKIQYSFKKINNKFFYKKINKTLEYSFFNNLNFEDEFSFSKLNNYNFLNYNNKLNINKKFKLNSSSQSIAFADKNLRSMSNMKINNINQLFNTNLNELTGRYNNSFSSFELNPYSFYKSNLLYWSNPEIGSRLSLSKINIDTPHTPLASSNIHINTKNYDNLKKNLVFQGKEELTTPSIPSIYWNFYFSTVNNNWRLKNSTSFFSFKDAHYMSPFSLYYDYDFRNWQALELLEDAFWESSFSVYLNDEYQSVLNDFNELSVFDKGLVDFLAINSSLTNKSDYYTDNSFLFNEKNLNQTNMPYFFQEDGFFDPYLLINKNFYFLNLQSNFLINEDSYENFKNQTVVFKNMNYNIFEKSNPFFTKLIYSDVLNSFRSDYDEFSFLHENENSDFSLLNINADSADYRVIDSVNIRNTAKNSIVTYNAIQKIFKTRLDEYRSNAKIDDFSNSFSKQPFVDSKRTHYESMLKKNKITFFENTIYSSSLKKNLTSLKFLDLAHNFSVFDFPFLISQKGDPSRHIWFDWFAKWGFLEIQPASSAKYAIFGMPYFNKSFEYSSSLNESLNETENYFTRISRSRKNYMTNWVYTPFMSLKNNVWNKNNVFTNINNFNFDKNSVIKSKHLLANSNWYWLKLTSFNSSNKQFNYSNSGINSYNRSTWNPKNSIANYYYSTSILTDILSKREYMYRTFFLKKNSILNLPNTLTNNVNHPLLKEIRKNLNSIDFIINQSEYSRNVYYYSLNHFNFLLVSSYKNYLNEYFNFSFTLNTLLTYFFNSSFLSNHMNDSKTTDLFKNQYRPMKKGISNMVRLHSTGAVAMPIEMRIQILASSKDVIHSWAIPSAGIKIDCVPGYSSHRVIIFLVSGIFWGQCMEICGRYHHWMPIVVYFMKRDLFFLWCSHFIFLNSTSNLLTMNDRQNVSFSKLVSYDKTNWLRKL